MKIELKVQLNTLILLLTINFIIFIIALIVQSAIGFDNKLFVLFGGLDAIQVYNGNYWLLITSAFFHLDVLHFIFNMYALYRIGQSVQAYYDEKTLLIVYILGALGGSLLSYLSVLILHVNFLSLGASGAIFALIGLLIGGSLKKYRYGLDLPISFWDLLPIVLLSLWIGFIPGSQVNNWAHIGGLITGIILGFVLKHSLGGFISKSEKIIKSFLYYVSLIVLIGSFIALISNVINLLS